MRKATRNAREKKSREIAYLELAVETVAECLEVIRIVYVSNYFD